MVRKVFLVLSNSCKIGSIHTVHINNIVFAFTYEEVDK